MTETSYYPPTAAPRRNRSEAPGPVLLAIAGPAAQRRTTVAIRLVLAVPHLLALYVLGIAASVVAVIGWLGAMVTGRLPEFAATYLSGYLRWYSRVGGYLLLLTDEYPPFALEDAAYPVRLAVTPGGLNRLTVAFRILLAIPAAIVSTLLTSGFTTVVVFIAWLTALIAGRLPASLHQAFAAVLRYNVRCYGYLYLLTGSYPAGLFGDAPGARPAAVPPPGSDSGYGTGFPGQPTPYPGYGSPAAYGPPSGGYQPPTGGYGASAAGYGAQTGGYGAPTGGYGAQTAGYGAPAGNYATDAAAYRQPAGPSGYGPSGYGTPWPPSQPAAQATASAQAASWELVLSSGAKRLVGLILALGLLTAAGEGAWTGATISAAIQRAREISQLNTAVTQFNAAVTRHNAAVTREEEAASQVSDESGVLSNAHDRLVGVLNSPSTDFNNCSTVSCFNVEAGTVANAFAAFGRTLRATSVPAGSAAIAKRLATETTGTEQDWTEITHADSFTSVEDSATAAEQVGGRFDSDYSALTTSLGNAAAKLSNQAATLNKEAATLNRRGAALNRQAAALNVTAGVRPASEA